MSKEQQSFYPDEKTKAILKEVKESGETISHFINAAIAEHARKPQDLARMIHDEADEMVDEQTMIIQNMLSIQMTRFEEVLDRKLNGSDQKTTKSGQKYINTNCNDRE